MVKRRLKKENTSDVCQIQNRDRVSGNKADWKNRQEHSSHSVNREKSAALLPPHTKKNLEHSTSRMEREESGKPVTQTEDGPEVQKGSAIPLIKRPKTKEAKLPRYEVNEATQQKRRISVSRSG